MRKLTILVAAFLLLATFAVAFQPLEVQAADQTYVVQRGDTLSGIAAKLGTTVSAIAQANGIANVNNIYAGQKLTIPSGTNSSTPAPATTGEAGYVVQPGDTLTGLASRFGVSIYELASANNLSVMSYLYVGQTLKVPGPARGGAPAPTTTPTPAATAPAPTAKPATSGSSYTVVAGDTLSSIAAKFGVTVQDIVDANGISNPNVLNVGQELVIPGSGGSVTPKPKPTEAPAANPASTGKWIDVNLSTQKLVAYDGSNPVFSSLVSTGIPSLPTVTGTFNIYVKYQAQLMTGGSGSTYYYLPNVPYVMYFYQAYALHGTYWHNNFGHPMSHGCVNLPTPAAQWMYNWAPVGTPVKVHY